MITELEFKSLAAQGYNRIPLMFEAFADLETPLSLYLKLAHARDGGKFSFLLESVVGGERFGRYSFIGLPAARCCAPRALVAEALTEVVTDGQVVETSSVNPLDFISDYQKRFKVALRPGLPRFCGGLAGYFGYDAVRYIEKKLENILPARHAGLPRHPAAAVRGAGRHRQPVGQALPDRLCRPGAARSLRQRQEAPARAERAAQVFGQRAQSSSRAKATRPSANSPRPTTSPPSSAPSG